MRSGQLYDVAIAGGGPAGLSAALILGRAVRNVVLFDDEKPRNTSAYAARGVFTRDGTSPRELNRIGREQLEPYPVTIEKEAVLKIGRTDDHFEVTAKSGKTVEARKVLLATGVVDMLPDIPGIEKFWGKSVVHCPYCHGWELRGKRIAALVDSETACNFAQLLRGWSHDLLLLSNGPVEINPEERERIDAHEIPIITEKILEFSGSYGQVDEVRFEGRSPIAVEAIFIHPDQKLHSGLGSRLDLEMVNDHRIQVNEYGETSIPGIYVAGDAGPNRQQVIVAASSGAQVGITINHMLLKEDFEHR